ncbi:MAG TPA: matrixin family metalloprotease [Thermoanaerobaculia bacterium]
MSTSRLLGLLGLLALALLPLLAAPPASATSYVPVTDESLVDQAPLIAVVEVQGSVPGQDGSRPFTGHRVRVEKVLKGAMATGLAITVRVPGGVRADGLALRIWGAPRFASGDRALLFLSPRLDGTYSIVHLMLGAFHEIQAGGHRLAVRHLAEARAVARPGEPLSAEPLRDFDRFVRWIAGRARGLRVRADYQVAALSGFRQITDEFALFEDSGYNLRWFEFDASQNVPWYAHQNGQLGVAGGGFAEFQTALAAWNNDSATNIAYTYAGTTTATDGLESHDTVNAILFNDPNNELPTFSCSGGGILAYGGPWYFSELTPHQGTFYHRIANADIVTANGLTCYFSSPNGRTAAEELFAHELGHTLGISHSEVDEALMRPYIHNDGRGASLRADDRAAIAALYTPPPPPADFFTVTPCRLLDTRDPDGPYGGPALQWWPRTFAAAGRCGIPSTAVALSVNVTAVSPSDSGFLTLFPAGVPQPNTSTLNFSAGQSRSNNAILLLSGTPQRTFIAVPAMGIFGAAVHLLVDVNGYFEPGD